jgi:hypothetical protein
MSPDPEEAGGCTGGQARLVSDRVPPPTSQLLLYRFGPTAEFEGQLVGALERIEAGGSMRVLDALFVSADRGTGELSAVGLRGTGAGGFVAPLIGFRLDPAERRRISERTARAGTKTIPAEIVREIGAALEPGCAIAAVLVEHVWAAALEDAVARAGGTGLSREFVEATALGELSPELLAAARGPIGPDAAGA